MWTQYIAIRMQKSETWCLHIWIKKRTNYLTITPKPNNLSLSSPKQTGHHHVSGMNCVFRHLIVKVIKNSTPSVTQNCSPPWHYTTKVQRRTMWLVVITLLWKNYQYTDLTFLLPISFSSKVHVLILIYDSYNYFKISSYQNNNSISLVFFFPITGIAFVDSKGMCIWKL